MVRFILFVFSILNCFIQIQCMVQLQGKCTSSVQCAGVAICEKELCSCPPEYVVVGATCVYMDQETHEVLSSAARTPPVKTPHPTSPSSTLKTLASTLSTILTHPSSTQPASTQKITPLSTAPVPTAHTPQTQNSLSSQTVQTQNTVYSQPQSLQPPQQAMLFQNTIYSPQALPQPNSIFNQPPVEQSPILPPEPPAILYAYPGSSCGSRNLCIGGSICVDGLCRCPPGYEQSAQKFSCVQNADQNYILQHIVPKFNYPEVVHQQVVRPQQPPLHINPRTSWNWLSTENEVSVADNSLYQMQPVRVMQQRNSNGEPFVSIACPAGKILMGKKCVPEVNIVQFPIGILCTGSIKCPGVAECVNSVCTCPAGHIWKESGCEEQNFSQRRKENILT